MYVVFKPNGVWLPLAIDDIHKATIRAQLQTLKRYPEHREPAGVRVVNFFSYKNFRTVAPRKRMIHAQQLVVVLQLPVLPQRLAHLISLS
jgi:hypothetical protein